VRVGARVTVTIWIAYYSDGSSYALFDTEVEALRYALENGMRVKSQDLDVLGGFATYADSGAFMPSAHRAVSLNPLIDG